MIDYNPYAPDVQHNPYPCWKQLRDEAPVYFNPEFNFYAITRFDDVLAAMLDPTTYISGQGVTIDGADRGIGFLISTDPPEHTWYRKLLSRVFTPRRVEELGPFVRRVAPNTSTPHAIAVNSTSCRNSPCVYRSTSSGSSSASRPNYEGPSMTFRPGPLPVTRTLPKPACRPRARSRP
jgi:hypothetical protein